MQRQDYIYLLAVFVCIASAIPIFLAAGAWFSNHETIWLAAGTANRTVIKMEPSPSFVDGIHLRESTTESCCQVQLGNEDKQPSLQDCRMALQQGPHPTSLPIPLASASLPYRWYLVRPLTSNNSSLEEAIRCDFHFTIRYEVLVPVYIASYIGLGLAFHLLVQTCGSRWCPNWLFEPVFCCGDEDEKRHYFQDQQHRHGVQIQNGQPLQQPIQDDDVNVNNKRKPEKNIQASS